MKSKKIRVSEEQKEMILDFMSRHPGLAAGRYSDSMGKTKQMDLWCNLSTMLNSQKVGAVKSVDKWIKTWDDWKFNARSKNAKIQRYCAANDEEEAPPVALNNLEIRLLQLVNDHLAVVDRTEEPTTVEDDDDVVTVLVDAPVGPGDGKKFEFIGAGEHNTVTYKRVPIHRPNLRLPVKKNADIFGTNTKRTVTYNYKTIPVCRSNVSLPLRKNVLLSKKPYGSSDPRFRVQNNVEVLTNKNQKKLNLVSTPENGKQSEVQQQQQKAASSATNVEAERVPVLQQINISLKKIASAMKQQAQASLMHARALERIARVKEAKARRRAMLYNRKYKMSL